MLSPHMYDSTRPNLIPSGSLGIAIYGNGLYKANYDEIKAQFPDARIWLIDVLGNGYDCGILDVETGDATPGMIYQWCDEREIQHDWEVLNRIYCNLSTWPTVKSYVAMMPARLRSTVRYWVADWTGQPHLVPGSDATQYENTIDWDLSYINVDRFG